MEELLNNVFAQVFILTASIGWSFWYMKREQQKEDKIDVRKRIEDYKASTSHNTALHAPTDVELQKDQLASILVESLRYEPHEWVCRDYTIKHKSSGVQIWDCQGESSTRVWKPCEVEFNEIQRKAIFKAVEELKLQRSSDAAYYRIARATAKNKKHKAVGDKYRAVPVKKKTRLLEMMTRRSNGIW